MQEEKRSNKKAGKDKELFNVNILSYSSQRKYQEYFGIKCSPDEAPS